MPTKKSHNKEYFSDRRVITFLHPKYVKLVTALSADSCLSKSSTVGMMVKNHFDGMDEKTRKKYLEIYDRLTTEQKKNPKNGY